MPHYHAATSFSNLRIRWYCRKRPFSPDRRQKELPRHVCVFTTAGTETTALWICYWSRIPETQADLRNHPFLITCYVRLCHFYFSFWISCSLSSCLSSFLRLYCLQLSASVPLTVSSPFPHVIPFLTPSPPLPSPWLSHFFISRFLPHFYYSLPSCLSPGIPVCLSLSVPLYLPRLLPLIHSLYFPLFIFISYVVFFRATCQISNLFNSFSATISSIYKCSKHNFTLCPCIRYKWDRETRFQVLHPLLSTC